MRKFVVATVEDGQVKFCTNCLDGKTLLMSRKDAFVFRFVDVAFDTCDMLNDKHKKTKPYFVMQI